MEHDTLLAQSESPSESRPQFGKIQRKNYHKKHSTERCVVVLSSTLVMSGMA